MMWLLYRLLDRDLADSIAGDLEEYARRHYPLARTRGELWKWRQLPGIVIAAVAERVRDAIVRPKHAAARDTRAWTAGWARDLTHDVGYAARMLRRNPGFSLTAILTLALGIGCTTAIFSVVNALILRSLPYDAADRLVEFGERLPPELSANDPYATASPEVADTRALRERSRTLSHLGIHVPTERTMTVKGETVRVTGAHVQASIFEMLHAQPLLGRAFDTRDEGAAAERGVILSFTAWHRYFRGNPNVLAQRVLLDGELVTIVGVMSATFAFPNRQTEIWTPLFLATEGSIRLPVLARLADGVSIDTARQEIGAVIAKGDPDRQTGVVVMEVKEALVGPVKPALTVLMVSVGLVLLLACANVANLLVARALARRRELAVRKALGAGQSRLVRQVLTESVLLSVIGGIAGVALAVGMIEVLRTIGTGLMRSDLVPGLSIPRLDEVRIDGLALAFTVSVSVLAGTIFGLVPAIEQSRPDSVDLLRGDRGAGFGLTGRRPIQAGLMVQQMAVAMLLLIAAGLQIRSFVKVSTVDSGYDASNVLTFQVLFPDNVGPATFSEDLVAALRQLPDVRAAGYSTSLPMVQSGFAAPVSRTPGPPPHPPAPGSLPTPEVSDTRAVSRSFLGTLGVQVIEGRGFADVAPSSSLPPILINRAFARTGYLGNQPIGQQVYVGGRLAEVVGIVNDVRQVGLDQPAAPQVFGLAAAGPAMYYAVRTNRRPASQVATIRQIVRRLVPEAGLYNVATMDQIASNSIARRRLYAIVMGAFAAIAAILAAVGLYGMVAYAVALRTREIGIRIALGAGPRRVLGLMLRDVGGLVAIGLPLGAAGALALSRSLGAMLFELSPFDPVTYASVAILFLLVSLAAAFVAARRAATADPLAALRSE